MFPAPRFDLYVSQHKRTNYIDFSKYENYGVGQIMLCRFELIFEAFIQSGALTTNRLSI